MIPVITGTGRRLEMDSDDWPRRHLAEACESIDPRLWDLFADYRTVPPSTPARRLASSTPSTDTA